LASTGLLRCCSPRDRQPAGCAPTGQADDTVVKRDQRRMDGVERRGIKGTGNPATPCLNQGLSPVLRRPDIDVIGTSPTGSQIHGAQRTCPLLARRQAGLLHICQSLNRRIDLIIRAVRKGTHLLDIRLGVSSVRRDPQPPRLEQGAMLPKRWRLLCRGCGMAIVEMPARSRSGRRTVPTPVFSTNTTEALWVVNFLLMARKSVSKSTRSRKRSIK
jgi:hypothetical protein